jgi:DNA-binding response OmpR family regulator
VYGRDPTLMPQVVLVDLKLPIIDGLGVLRRIREDARTKRLPEVILTTSTEERDIVSGYDLRANSFVRKPVDFAEVLEAARQLGLVLPGIERDPARCRRNSVRCAVLAARLLQPRTRELS